MDKIKTLIVEQQFLIREGIVSVLSRDPNYSIALISDETDELARCIDNSVQTLLLVDLCLFDCGRLSSLIDLKLTWPYLKILVLVDIINPAELQELNEAGLTHFLLKSATEDELSEALENTLKGKKYYSDKILEALIRKNNKKTPSTDGISLTVTEMEIVRYIASGKTTKEIAAEKHISFHTVMTHRKNIFRKLGVTNTSELVMYAVRTGWISEIEYYI